MSQDPAAPPDDLEAIWRRAREQLRSSLPGSTFRLWIEPLRALRMHGSTLYVSAPAAARAWVERRYVDRMAAALRRQEPAIDRIVVLDAETGEPPGGEGGTRADAPRSLAIDPAHTFERFVIGPGNRLAHAAALAVAELPGEAYNPLFLHGPPGLGKTHLLGGIANYIHRRHPELTVHLTTAERFTSEFVASLRTSGPEEFKRRYRELDALLIDDIQTLEGKQKTEEEFVYTFNALYTAGKQIVLSSDRPPDALSRLAQRLRDRFAWGLTVELEPPDLRTRTTLLLRIAADSPGELPEPAALREVARLISGNVRRLEGAMTRVIAFASLLDEPLTRGIADRALQGPGQAMPFADGTTEPSLQAIQGAVCDAFGVERDQLLSPSRTTRVVRARQVAMHLARDLTSLSIAAIARAFQRDHSTVLYAICAVQDRLATEPDVQLTIQRIRKTLDEPTLSLPTLPAETPTP